MVLPFSYIGLGANLGDPPAQLRSALDALRHTPGIEVTAVSGFYRTAPLGPSAQPDYCNAVCAVRTALSPEALLDALQRIERAAGRVRDGRRWGPRVLDLDLLLFEGHTLQTARLSLPHPQLHLRAFVLVPLAEIAPDLPIPGLGTVQGLLAQVNRCGVKPGFAQDFAALS
jgi:2-amino-4-hydroxy-6-hydroxymethyldihydropteridine diphosphokinase